MRIRIICLFLALFSIQLLWAQSARSDLYFHPEKSMGWQSETVAIPLERPEPFIAVSLAWKGVGEHFDVRFSADGQRWKDWIRLHLDPHGEQSPERYVSELYFADADSRYVQFKATGPVEQLQAHFYNPGATEKKTGIDEAPIDFRGPEYCPCPQPAYEGREGWCPDGTCPPDPSPDVTSATHLIVHHSAGTNAASDWAAVVRSIWDFHTVINGWSDVGYNWLIDPNGVIYEGRGDGILGAHFCCKNGRAMGVCVLGDFTNITPTAEALNALRELLAWKACDISVDPLGEALHSGSGLTLMHISGHRDGFDPNESGCRRCATACPGDSFYPLLSGVRDSVAAYIASSCAAIGTPQQLTATAVSETEALLEWTDGSDNETAFLIERAESFNGDYEEVGSTAENVTTYNDTGLEPQSAYYYRVRSANEQDTSGYSNKAFVYTRVVGLDGPLGAGHVRLFPNPAKDQLTVALDSELSGTVLVRLLDTTGREAWSTEMQGGQWTLEVPMKNRPGGLYLVQLQHGEETAVYKAVRE